MSTITYLFLMENKLNILIELLEFLMAVIGSCEERLLKRSVQVKTAIFDGKVEAGAQT